MPNTSAIRFAETGGPVVLQITEAELAEPGPGQALVGVHASGVNFIDTYHRSGLYPVDRPFIPGSEGAGIVEAVGADVTDVAVGDRVAWVGVPGSYAGHVLAPADTLLSVPDGVSLDIAAAVPLQGMTAHYLACSTWPLEPGQRCLIHAGAGGTGRVLIQIAKIRGAEVFTTVGTEEKAELARSAGADHVIMYRDEDFGDAVERIAGPKSLDVVYDGVGKDTFDRGLELLRPRGMMVTFGNASGPVDPVLPLRLSQGGSLFLTRPSLFDYISTRDDLEWRAGELFGWIADGQLEIMVGDRIPLSEARRAHEAIQGRATTGKVLLIP